MEVVYIPQKSVKDGILKPFSNSSLDTLSWRVILKLTEPH
jgi:hypothetical protein